MPASSGLLVKTTVFFSHSSPFSKEAFGAYVQIGMNTVREAVPGFSWREGYHAFVTYFLSLLL